MLWSRGLADYFAHEDYLGGEVVGVAVEVRTRSECAQWVALAGAFGVAQEVVVVDDRTLEVPHLFVAVGQISGEDDLVEQVPRTLVGEGADAVVEQFRNKHLLEACQLFEGELMTEFMEQFDVRLDAFRNAILGSRVDPLYRDNVVSQGERFSSLMLSYVLKRMGLKSASLSSEEAGIVAVGNPMSGSADLLKTA